MAAKVLVIGSNSFSGGDFIDLLLENTDYDVTGISRSPEKSEIFLKYKKYVQPKYAFEQIDLNRDRPRLIELLGELRPEFIVNFAAQSEVGPSWKTPWDWFETNTVALTHILDHLKNIKTLRRYVHISSPEVYGSCEGIVREDAPLNPSTPYAASKAAADLLLMTYVKNFSLPVSFVRATNVYGACQQLFKIIPRTVINLRSGKIQDLHGGGQAVKSYIHVRDISRGELAVMERGKSGEIYHFSPDGGISVRDLVRKICERMGKNFSEVTRDVEERLGQDKAYVIDSTKARSELGWAPAIPLDQGLDEVVEWIENYWEQIRPMPLEYLHRA